MPVLISPTVSNEAFFGSLIKALSASSTVFASSTSTADFLQIIKTYCYVGQCSINNIESADRLTVIVDSRDGAVIQGLLYILQNPQTMSRPRVVLLSSIQTWAGTQGCASIREVNAESFWNRVPVTGEHTIYTVENQLCTLLLHDKLPTFELCIMPLGLVYGGAGGDLAAEFDALWRWDAATNTPIRLRSMVAGANIVPLIHQDDLANTLVALCSAENVPLYLPAAGADNSEALLPLLKHLFTLLNGTISAAADDSIHPVVCMEETEVLEELIASNSAYPRTLLWSANVDFSSQCAGKFSDMLGVGIVERLPETWKEFLAARQLTPLSVFIAGTPGSGKTELAKSLCVALGGARYVTIEAAIMHVVQCTKTDNVDTELKNELYTSIESEMQKTKPPPKKGEAEVPVELDPATFELTPAVQAVLSPDMLRRCLASYIRLDTLCIRRGYVIDIWGIDVITSWSDLVSATCEAGPELIVEIQASTEALVARLCNNLGIADGTLAKAPKDQQAAVKALEEKLGAYVSKMGDIVYPGPTVVEGEEEEAQGETKKAEAEEEPVEPEFKTSHAAIIDIEIYAKRVFRINANDISSNTVQRAVCGQLLQVHGIIGWLTEAETVALTTDPIDIAAAEVMTSTTEQAAEVAVVTSSVNVSPSPEKSNATSSTLLASDPQSISKARILSTMEEAQGETKQILIDKTNELQHYLLVHVMPELAQGMVQIAQNKPVDPILYIAEHLETLASQRENIAEAKALAYFQKLLAMAEGTWVEPLEEPEASVAGSGASLDGDGGESISMAEGSIEGDSVGLGE